MGMKWHIENLNDLFYALFRPNDGAEPVVKGHSKPVREETFQLFFPEDLCAQYLNRSKSNLTWFFNNDRKNKAIRNTLIDRLNRCFRKTMDEMYQKCRDVLWPHGQHPAFDREGLREVLLSIRIPSSMNAKLHIQDSPAAAHPAQPARMSAYFDADPAAALVRAILTLAVHSDCGEETLRWIWYDAAPQSDPRPFSREETIGEQIRRGKLLYLNGQHEQAYQLFEQIASTLDRPAENAEESDLYCRMAGMLLTGDGHYRDEAAALRYLQLSCLDENPESHYLLARNSEGETALESMKKAAQLGYGAALRELGNAYYNGSRRFACEKDIETARSWFRRGLNSPDKNGAYCAYMLGRIHEDLGETEAAVRSYMLAQERGNPDAQQRLFRLNRLLPGEDAVSEQAGRNEPLRICIMNAGDGSNSGFAASLSGPWQLHLCADRCDLPQYENTRLEICRHPHTGTAQLLRQLGSRLFDPAAESFPDTVISLLSANHQDNLQQCIAVMHVVEDLALHAGTRKWEVIDAVRIHVEAEHDYASLMLDAAFANLHGLYCRVRLCDPANDSADRLFASAPLFLPCLNNPDLDQIRLVVIGASETAMAVVRRAIALPVSENRDLQITSLSEDAESMAQRFSNLCPGMEIASTMISRPMPRFLKYDSQNGGIPALIRQLRALRGEAESLPEAAEVLAKGNYFVIATGDDTLNIRLGVALRTGLIKADPSFTHLPFIAVHVADPMVSRLTQNLVAGSGAQEYSWHSRYNLINFGTADLYTWNGLENDPAERRALAVHMQYSGNTSDEIEIHLARAAYYRRQYNRDSSRAMAQYLVYRLFDAGITLPDWRLYGIPDEEAACASAYAEWLQDAGHLAEAARMEHHRWNCYMLSMGWEPATPVQVNTYVQQGNPGHQLHLAKLHPFICDWKRLESGELLREVEEAVHSVYPDKRVVDPCTADREAVAITPQILTLR